MKAFEIKNISFSYPSLPEKKILDDLSLSIDKGLFVCITGPVGGGKSTLSLMMNGLLKPKSGKISIFGLEDEKEIRKAVQIVFQDPDNFFVSETVETDTAFALENRCVESSEIRKRVDLALKTLGIENLAKRRISTLSGGQKQLAALSGALAAQPQALVLDEALSMLDKGAHERVLKILKSLCEKDGLTVVLFTHRADEVSAADKTFILKEGRCSEM